MDTKELFKNRKTLSVNFYLLLGDLEYAATKRD